MARFVLGSASPRRSELLLALGVEFVADAADLIETTTDDPAADAERLAREKATAVVGRHIGAIVLAADTIVADGARSYGKPRDESDARQMLSALCGTEHAVYTGIAVAGPEGIGSNVSVNKVWLHPFTADQIANYVSTTDHMDKAGGYAIQDTANPIAERFEGCYCAIMGLPLWEARRLLRTVGLDATEPSGALTRCAACPERE